MLEAEKQQVAAVSRRLAAEGLVLAAAGNVSARAGELCAVTPTGARLEAVQADDVVVVDAGGRLVEGERAPSSELTLHLGAYRRYGAGAVVHAHPPVATALGASLGELPAVHYQMAAFGGPVRVAPYATPGSAELAEQTLDAMESRTAVLMANHGTLTIGADLGEALDRALLLEWVCTVYWRAASLGRPRTLTEAELATVAGAMRARENAPVPAPRLS